MRQILIFNDNEFDRVFCISVLEHLEEELVNGKRVNYHKKNLDVKAIGEMLRVVKPNGLVVLTIEWSESSDDIQSYRIKDIYERLLKPYRSLLVEDKHLEVNWEILRHEHYESNKKFRPDYPATEGWAIGIILRKEN